MASFNERPRFSGGNKHELRNWALKTALPWLTENLGLTAGAICGSLDESLRREVYGLAESDQLPKPIDWSKNGIVISPPGTGKGMAIFVEALAHYEKVYVLVPSVIQAHKLEQSLDVLYHHQLGGCLTSQRKADGLISIITTGIFHQMVRDKSSDLWDEKTCLIVDEAQRILEQDPLTEFMVGYMAHHGLQTMIVSATIAPGNLAQVYGHGSKNLAEVYELQKQMHPVKILPTASVRDLPELKQRGTTTLVFAPSRKKIMEVVRNLQKDPNLDVWAIPVTGAHMVEEQLLDIKTAQKTGKPVVVVATPGTMDSSVTIPGLTSVMIWDERIVPGYTEDGVRVLYRESLPINHIWQMIRRVGREARTDGKKDKVYLISSSQTVRTDILAENPTFEPIKGCDPNTPIHDLLLEAVRLDVPFEKVHDYMVSTFSSAHIEKHRKELFEHGMIEAAEEAQHQDGLQLTLKGSKVVDLPFEYKWSRLVADAPEELRIWLAIAASSQSFYDLKMFEEEQKIEADPMSVVIAKIKLGVDYLTCRNDDEQRYMLDGRDISFRRMEQMEQLFSIACRAMRMDESRVKESLQQPVGEQYTKLLDCIVVGGTERKLFTMFLVHKGNKGAWTEVVSDPTGNGNGTKRVFVDDNGTDMEGQQNRGVVGVVADYTITPGGISTDNNTIIPYYLLEGFVTARAMTEGWFQLSFENGSFRGKPQMEATKNGVSHIASPIGFQPEPGIPYWCSVDRNFGYDRKSVLVHYPAI